MDDNKIPVEQTPRDNICSEIIRMAIDEYGIIPLLGVCTCAIIGAGIGGLVGIKMLIK